MQNLIKSAALIELFFFQDNPLHYQTLLGLNLALRHQSSFDQFKEQRWHHITPVVACIRA